MSRQCTGRGPPGRNWNGSSEPSSVFSTSGTFSEEAENMQEIKTGAFIEPIPFKIDYKRVRAAKRQSMKHSLEGTDDKLELVVFGNLFEQNTIASILKEMELHSELEAADTKLMIPSVATAWGHYEELREDIGTPLRSGQGL